MRNGPVRNKQAAVLGTGTYDALLFMKEYLRANTPDGAAEDVRGAAEYAKTKCENLGLAYGKLWDEHGVSWLIGLYNAFVLITDTPDPVVVTLPPVVVSETIRRQIDEDSQPGPTTDDGDFSGPDPIPPFEPVEKKTLINALATRYILNNVGGPTSQAKAIGLWSKREIRANCEFKQTIINGKSTVLDEWLRLMERLPNEDSVVHEFVTEDELATFRLRGGPSDD